VVEDADQAGGAAPEEGVRAYPYDWATPPAAVCASANAARARVLPRFGNVHRAVAWYGPSARVGVEGPVAEVGGGGGGGRNGDGQALLTSSEDDVVRVYHVYVSGTGAGPRALGGGARKSPDGSRAHRPAVALAANPTGSGASRALWVEPLCRRHRGP
jgi:hypothetical protein